MTFVVVGLCGAKGSGKTTAFEAFRRVHSSRVTEITIARKLKDVCSEVLKIPRAHFDSHTHKEKPLDRKLVLDEASVGAIIRRYGFEPSAEFLVRHVGVEVATPRFAAQYVGTEILRSLAPDVHCLAAVGELSHDDRVGVVTDIRFPDELIFFSNRFEIFVPVYIKNALAEERAGSDSHASEKHLGELARLCRVTIDNAGSRDLFEETSGHLLRDIVDRCIAGSARRRQSRDG